MTGIFEAISKYVGDKLDWINQKLQAMRDAISEIATLGGAETQTFN
jgi:hypothetical protein